MKYFLTILVIIFMFSGCSHKEGTEKSQSGKTAASSAEKIIEETEDQNQVGEELPEEEAETEEQVSSANEQTSEGQELSPKEKITEEDKSTADNSNPGNDITSDKSDSPSKTIIAGDHESGENETATPGRKTQEQSNTVEKQKAGQKASGEKTSSTGTGKASEDKENSGKDLVKQEDISEQEDTSGIKVTQEDIFVEFEEIDAILSKSKKGTGNFLAEITGTAEQLDAIYDQSQEALQNEDTVKTVIEKCEDDKKLVQYYDNITEYRKDLQSIKDEIKSARKEQEVEVLKQKLTELSSIIDDYNDYLLEV